MFLVGRCKTCNIKVSFKFYFSETVAYFPEVKGKFNHKTFIVDVHFIFICKNGEIIFFSFHKL